MSRKEPEPPSPPHVLPVKPRTGGLSISTRAFEVIDVSTVNMYRITRESSATSSREGSFRRGAMYHETLRNELKSTVSSPLSTSLP